MDLLDASYQIPAHVLATPAGEEMAILDVEQDRYLSLNKSGAKIWEFLNQGLTGRQVVDQIAQEYDIDRSRLEHDTFVLLTDLVDRGMIQIANGNAAE